MNKILWIRHDLKASIVIFFVALPLCMGIALASGAPIMSGILAGIIGGIVVGAVSSSKYSVTGPAAGLTLVVLNAVQTLGDFYTFTLAVFLAGLIQILLGLANAGRIGEYFPNSVVKGVLTAIGINIVLKQIPHALGLDSGFIGAETFFQNDGNNTITTLVSAFSAWNQKAAILSAVSLVVLFAWNSKNTTGVKFFDYLPAPLFVVALGIAINEFAFPYVFGTKLDQSNLVNLPLKDGIYSLINEIKLPNWNALNDILVYKVAFSLALVASLENMLSIEAVDKLDPKKNFTNKNKEFIAQGVGNIVSGLIGAIPVTSVIVRSSANIGAGAKSKLSTMLHGAWMLLAILFAYEFLEMIPLASLAAILIYVGYRLCKPAIFKQMHTAGKSHLIPFLVTVFAILLTDILMGIVIGVAFGFIFVLKASHSKSIVMVNEEKNYLIRFMKDVSFLNKPEITELLKDIPAGAHLIIDGTNHVSIDDDVILIIQDFVEAAPAKEISVEILRAKRAINPYFKGVS